MSDLILAAAEDCLMAYKIKPTWAAEGCEALSQPMPENLFGIAFRGTDGLADAGIDLWAFPRRHPRLGMVHAGFSKGVDAVHPLIIASLPDRGVPMLVTGHSKGGAEAEEEATLLCLDGYNVKFLITFNPPRHAMGGLMRDVLAKAGVVTLRAVARGDPVSHLPPWAFGYAHLFRPTYFGEGWDTEPDHPMRAIYEDIIGERVKSGAMDLGQAAIKKLWAAQL